MFDQLSMPFLCLSISNQKLRLTTPYIKKPSQEKDATFYQKASFLCGYG